MVFLGGAKLNLDDFVGRRAFLGASLLTLVFDGAAFAANPESEWTELERYFATTIGRPSAERGLIAGQVLKRYDEAAQGGREVGITLLALGAAALGTMARLASPAESLSQRYGSRSKKLLTELRAQRPVAAWPKLLEGVWHYEVVRRGGVVGSALLQATVETGDQLLRSATELMPISPAGPFAHAVAMWSMDPAVFREPARKLIDLAIERAEGAVQGPLVNTIGAHARALKDVDAGGDASALQRSALTIM